MPRCVDGAQWTIRLTAFLAFAGYVLALASCRGRTRRAGPSGSGWWSLGLAAFLTHVACAFHFEHGWSHARALLATTAHAAVIGIDFGADEAVERRRSPVLQRELVMGAGIVGNRVVGLSDMRIRVRRS